MPTHDPGDPFGLKDPSRINRELSALGAQLNDLRKSPLIRSPFWTIAWSVVLSYFCLLFTLFIIGTIIFLAPGIIGTIVLKIEEATEERRVLTEKNERALQRAKQKNERNGIGSQP